MCETDFFEHSHPFWGFDYVNALFIFLFLLRSERKHFMELHWRILKSVCHLSQDSVIFSCFGFLVYIFGLIVYICWVFYLELKHLCSNFGIPVLIYFGLAYHEFEFRYYLVLICVTLCFGSGLFLVISLRFLFESCSASFQCLCLGPAVFSCQLCVSYSLIFFFYLSCRLTLKIICLSYPALVLLSVCTPQLCKEF